MRRLRMLRLRQPLAEAPDERLEATACSVVVGQCDTCRDMADFLENELPKPCGWNGCAGTVSVKIRPPNAQAKP